MKGQDNIEKVRTLTKRYLEEQTQTIRVRADKAFRVLLCVEWIFGVLCAVTISPQTWSGGMSSIHLHVWTSVLLGGVIVGPPIFLTLIHQGYRNSGHIVACSQMLFVCLLIHLMGVRLEAHFYIFGSLAFLAIYRQWSILVPATLIVVVDHVVRGYVWPQSVYGILTGAEWRWLEHAGWVIFEVIFLIISIVQSQKDMENIAVTRAKLEVHNSNIESLVQELKEKQSQLVQSAKLASLGEMSSGVAHELNNPLHFINGFNNRIKKLLVTNEHVTRSQIENYTAKISENCERMRKIIQHFRDFSRQAEHQLEPISVNEVVSKSFVLLQEQLRLRNIVVESHFCPGSPQILGDANRLEQVLVNLITNARDALRDVSNPKLTVSTTRTDDQKIVIDLADNGSGISKENLEKIFNPFFTTKEVGKGTGLGLSIAHSIIKEHKGEIVCQSQVGQGTKFQITLSVYEIENLNIKTG